MTSAVNRVACISVWQGTAAGSVGLHKTSCEVPRDSGPRTGWKRHPQDMRGLHSDKAPEAGNSHLVWGLQEIPQASPLGGWQQWSHLEMVAGRYTEQPNERPTGGSKQGQTIGEVWSPEFDWVIYMVSAEILQRHQLKSSIAKREGQADLERWMEIPTMSEAGSLGLLAAEERFLLCPLSWTCRISTIPCCNSQYREDTCIKGGLKTSWAWRQC